VKRVYLDYAAATPAHPDVINMMTPMFSEVFGNPSSIHACGQEARSYIEESRRSVARLIGARPEEIYFTSGGTEADNWALQGIVFANRSRGGNHIITSTIEHHAIHQPLHFLREQGFSFTEVPVDRFGMVDPDTVKKAITPKTILISIMHSNNEVGTIQPIEDISKIARKAGVYLHTDAVQSVGHVPIDVNTLGVDLLSSSAHKFYGPKGIGILFIRQGTTINPFIYGGAQEKNYRAGTENVPAIAGMGKAAEIALKDMNEEMRQLIFLRDKMIKGILDNIEQTRLNGHPVKRLPNNVNFSFEFVEGESICLNLDLAGICVATGSACSSESMEASHVLLAMGLPPEIARASVRLTSGKWTTEAEVDFVLEQLPKVVNRLRSISPLSTKNKR
jgi:cysteine desulfurase